jgi:anion-transporting  ArsA/GET3 family ATPase
VSVAELLAGKRICICAGPGGVGKTTVSAAVAIGMAAAGSKVGLVTIDPARRLADALGLEELGNEPRRVAGVEGELWAMMLDAKRTLDDLVELLAPDARTRDDVLSNRIYQQLSNAVAGTQEFSAVAKLYELDRSGAFDLIVLDTPPSRSALDFLDAPDRLASFLEGRALKAFLRPAGIGMRIVGGGTGLVFRILGRVTGIDLLEDLSVFFHALGGITGGFGERAAQVNELLRARDTIFLLVTSPAQPAIDETLFFHSRLHAAAMPFGGVIVNRVHHDAIDRVDADRIAESLRDALGEPLARRVAHNLADYQTLVLHDRAAVARLTAQLGVADPIEVPRLDRDVHDLDGLRWLERFVFAGSAERRRLMSDVVS